MPGEAAKLASRHTAPSIGGDQDSVSLRATPFPFAGDRGFLGNLRKGRDGETRDIAQRSVIGEYVDC